jgi:hypothetical protein
MIPSLAIIAVRRPERRPVRLWIPLALVWILLAPFALLGVILAACFWIAGGWRARTALAAVWTLGAVFAALSGTLVEVRAPRALVLVHLI